MFGDPNSEEICQPIRMLEGVLTWEPPKEPNWAVNVLKRTERSEQCYRGLKQCRQTQLTGCKRLPRESVPKTLYCHDMAGGYLNDKYAKGNSSEEGFQFFRWSCVDIFVYFSHNLLTIPPLGWINAAHKNGVVVLGTIITEGPKGEAIWKKILNDRKVIAKFINALARICQYYGFEGYLLNVENSLPPDKMNLFYNFITELRELLKTINSDNILIWYDSVVGNGSVYYQNCLNNLNRKFFDITDGIFLNYAWSDSDLKVSAANAGNRVLDVFVGVDVFGRGCKGGGGFKTIEAVEAAREMGLSVALFAPGWVHECCLPGETFLSRDFKFWDFLCEHLYVCGPSFLPFKTTFCLGTGKKFFVKGKLEKSCPWYDLSKQDYQISGLIGWHGTIDSCLSYYDEDAYNGGGSLLIKSNPAVTTSKTTKQEQHVDRLFVCDFKTTIGDILTINVITKALLIKTSPQLLIIVGFEENEEEKSMCLEAEDHVVLTDLNQGDRKVNQWLLCNYILRPPSGRIFEIGCMLVGDKSPLLIGEIAITKININTKKKES